MKIVIHHMCFKILHNCDPENVYYDKNFHPTKLVMLNGTVYDNNIRLKNDIVYYDTDKCERINYDNILEICGHYQNTINAIGNGLINCEIIGFNMTLKAPVNLLQMNMNKFPKLRELHLC